MSNCLSYWSISHIVVLYCNNSFPIFYKPEEVAVEMGATTPLWEDQESLLLQKILKRNRLTFVFVYFRLDFTVTC